MSDPIRRDPAFQPTSWTLVRQASDPEEQTLARRAMETFCADYWYPIYAFARRKGFSKEEAEDETQTFFACLNEEQWLAKAEPSEVKLRTFLLYRMQDQLRRTRERASAKKRGGGMQKLSIHMENAEGRYILEPEDPGMTPEALFDRAWALNTLERCLTSLSARWEANGKAEEFVACRPFLSLREAGDSTGAEVAAKLGISEANARQKINRLRIALREILRHQVGSSLADDSPQAVEGELANLREALN